MEIQISKDHSAIIDDDDTIVVNKYNWHIKPGRQTVYAETSVWLSKEKRVSTISMHRLILGLRIGDKRQVDHVDGNGLNNSKSNLRIASSKQNAHNRPSQNGSISRYKGVTFHKRIKKWHAYIRVDNKLLHLGYHESEDCAAIAYNNAALKYFDKDFVRLNNVKK